MAREKSKAKATSKPSNAANVGQVDASTVLRTLQAIADPETSPIPALAQAANLAVQITTTVQVHLSTNHRQRMYS